MNDAPRPLSDQERLDWLRLARSRNVGPITFRDLLRLTGSAGAALAALPELSRRAGRGRTVTACPRADAEHELSALADKGGRLIAAIEPDYPELLRLIADPPPVISVLGAPALLARTSVGIVGARNASAAGGVFARQIAAALGGQGYAVVSGLARGIDTQAHQGALPFGTVAVVAGGIDVVYPEENQSLYEQIAGDGAVVSEQPFGMVPQGRHFPRRNRIISGLSLGVVVVEASLRSGSLITARLAGEQGREVFAVPGFPLDARHRGTNRLLRDGATLTESADDVVEILAAMSRPRFRESRAEPPIESHESRAEPAETTRDLLRDKLSTTPVSVDELVRQCQVSPADILTLVLELELAGVLLRHPNGDISLNIKDG